MPEGPRTSRRVKYFAELLLFAIPTGFALARFRLSWPWFFGALGAVLVVAGVAKYVAVYRPRLLSDNRKLTSFLDHHLELLVMDLSQSYGLDCDVRANVMVPQRQVTLGEDGAVWRLSYDKVLKIAYCAGGGPDSDLPTHEAGKTDETKTGWSIRKPVEGNCGRAFVGEGVRVASRNPSETNWTSHETTLDQDQATKPINTILSVPIRRPSGGHPVAVLNIDASATVEETPFEDEKFQQEIAEKYAEPIGILL